MVSKEQVLTAEEVAELFRIHPYTIKRLARAGKVPGFKIGGQWRFNKGEMQKLMTKGKKK